MDLPTDFELKVVEYVLILNFLEFNCEHNTGKR